MVQRITKAGAQRAPNISYQQLHPGSPGFHRTPGDVWGGGGVALVSDPRMADCNLSFFFKKSQPQDLIDNVFFTFHVAG